jgi:hypothetical protein
VDHREDGWKQIEAGLALVGWSGLATLYGDGYRLQAHGDDDHFEALANERHQTYGRVMSWVVFAVGCEYILKGACQVKGLNVQAKTKPVLRVPPWESNLEEWAKAAQKGNNDVMEQVMSTKPWGQLPLAFLFEGTPGKEVHVQSMKLLGQTIRNRDAHRYVQEQRAAHFHAVPRMFIPALNALLDQLVHWSYKENNNSAT